MDNSQMKAGRFLRLQKGRKLYAWIMGHLEAGRNVYISTQTRVTKLSRKHSEMVKLGKSGSVYLNRDCIDYCNFTAQ